MLALCVQTHDQVTDSEPTSSLQRATKMSRREGTGGTQMRIPEAASFLCVRPSFLGSPTPTAHLPSSPSTWSAAGAALGAGMQPSAGPSPALPSSPFPTACFREKEQNGTLDGNGLGRRWGSRDIRIMDHRTPGWDLSLSLDPNVSSRRG